MKWRSGPVTLNGKWTWNTSFVETYRYFKSWVSRDYMSHRYKVLRIAFKCKSFPLFLLRYILIFTFYHILPTSHHVLSCLHFCLLSSQESKSSGRSSMPRCRNSVATTTSDDQPHIGNYRLLKTIGKGNFAKVKLARHVLTGKEVGMHANTR